MEEVEMICVAGEEGCGFKGENWGYMRIIDTLVQQLIL
jgi:hypothetical protein